MAFLKKLISPPHGALEIKLEKNGLNSGETLKGVLIFSSSENFVSHMTKCVVEQTEFFQHLQIGENMQQQMVTDARVLYSATQQLLGNTRYRKGQKISLPFAILIPKDASPSSKTNLINDIWSVKGIVAVDGRPDITTQLHFQVLS